MPGAFQLQCQTWDRPCSAPPPVVATMEGTGCLHLELRTMLICVDLGIRGALYLAVGSKALTSSILRGSQPAQEVARSEEDEKKKSGSYCWLFLVRVLYSEYKLLVGCTLCKLSLHPLGRLFAPLKHTVYFPDTRLLRRSLSSVLLGSVRPKKSLPVQWREAPPCPCSDFGPSGRAEELTRDVKARLHVLAAVSVVNSIC